MAPLKLLFDQADRVLAEAMFRRLEAERAPFQWMFPESQAAIRDPSQKKLLWTTRRAAKTTTACVDFITDGLQHPRARYAYIALTHPSAEDIVWPVLEELDMRFALGMKMIQGKLRATLPTKAAMKLYGADRPNWAKRLYGQKLRRVYIDEGAFFDISLYDLIEDYLDASVIDEDGQIWVMSIPGHLPRGLFDDAIKCFDGANQPLIGGVQCEDGPRWGGWKWGDDRPVGWSVHRWTTDCNPGMAAKFMAKIAKKRAENPDVDQDPRFQRNYLGLRVQELGERVYHFDPGRNTYPGDHWQQRVGDHYIIGMDFGWDDRQAFGVAVWRDDSSIFIEIESMRLQGVLLDEVYSYHKMYLDHYNTPGTDITTVGDAAHKQLFEEYRRRFDLDVLEAEKWPSKFDRISIYNSALRGGQIQVLNPARSPHVEEMMDLTWKKRPDGRLIEQPGALNDCADASLMAFEMAYHYLFKGERLGPQTEKEMGERERQRMREHAIKQAEEAEESAWNEL